jgi:NAD(P)-dependent dehydrogenase (short-subunit alcohol dehydrogenase family)
MDLGLKDQVAIVTGGSRGIGRAAAAAFLREGARVVVSSVRPESVEEALVELKPLGSVEGIAADVAVEADVVHLVSETVRRFGRLDVMVANAGIVGEEVNLADMSVEAWEEVMGVHLRGTFLCGREAVRAMRAAGIPGRIVTVGSVNGFETHPLDGRRLRQVGHPRQLRGARLGPHRHDGGLHPRAGRAPGKLWRHGPRRRAGGARQRDRLPGVGELFVLDRGDAGRRRWPGDRVAHVE